MGKRSIRESGQEAMNQPREYTKDEIRRSYLDAISNELDFWLHQSSRVDTKGKMEGLVFSILTILDGESQLPGCKVTVNSHAGDERYHKEQDENWFPNDVDIAGELHHMWYTVRGK